MSVPIIKTQFSAGEVSPSLFGHVDFAKFGIGASTIRNMTVNYRGGAYSRAGTKFVGFSKQTGRTVPPRLITFQYSINQGLVLEFGNYYMRVISNAQYVTDVILPMTGASKANPGQISFSASGSPTATPSNTLTSASYAAGDSITLAGGTYSVPAVLNVTSTTLVQLQLLSAGSGVYAPADTITLSGGTHSVSSIVTVASTQVVSATVNTAGTGGANGTATVTGTTGTGTKFQANVTISGGGITAVNSITLAGAYTANPTTPSAEPVTGASLTGAKLNLSIGVLTFTITTGGVYTVNPGGATFSQASTTGIGTGATFQQAVMGPNAVTVSNAGVYTVNPTNPVSQASTTGSGAGVTFSCTWTSSTPFVNGDWVFISSVNGMTQLNGRTFVVSGATPTTFNLTDVYGNNIDTTPYSAYASGGVISRIYTLTTPYAEADLQYIKYAQSANAMTLCCWNQVTGTSYATYDLVRVSANNWTLTSPTFAASISAPSSLSGSASAGGSTNYKYVVTAVSSADNSESIASNIASITSAVDISSTAGTISLSWGAVAGTKLYNIYKAPLGYNGTAIPDNSIYGYAGSSLSNSFVDSNIVADLSQVPPTHQNPLSGNNPGVCAYFQQRRFYAASPASPNTYWASQPGSYLDFDTRQPSLASDALTGSPWSVQVNGIQHMVPMPGGLVILTGSSAWQLSGSGSSATVAQPITPSTQQAIPQAYNGCSPTIPPIKIDYDILYVQAKGSIVRDFSYNYWVNIYTGADLTQISSHLFNGFTLREWGYCEEPFKILWAVRNDGVLLSLTFLKQQEIAGWARHDTQGAFQSVCSVIEPPVDALYLVTSRVTNYSSNAYMVERMDNRIWQNTESTWCVDAGLTLGQNTPNADLTISSAYGLGSITGVTNLVGGTGYSASTTAAIVDDNGQGPGSRAVPALTIVGGVITAISFAGNNGSGYVNPSIVFTDPSGTGAGASASPTLNNSATFSTSSAIFNSGMVGWYIRAGNGIAVITAYTDNKHVTANILNPVTQTIPNTANALAPFLSGSWTLSQPVTTISGLDHLAGLTVTGIADGNYITPRIVSASGSIALDTAATAVTVGLGFQCQLQSTYYDIGNAPTIQGQRKKIAAVTSRIEASKGLKVGCNQPDGSVYTPIVVAPKWQNMTAVPDMGVKPYNALTQPLYTGDVRVPMIGGFDRKGQVAMQQDYPFPMQVLALIAEIDAGDLTQPPGSVHNQGRR